MSKKHLAIWANLKTIIYIILSVFIIAHLIYVLKNPSEPPRLPSEGKSHLAKELNIEEYTPPIGTEVDVLCKVDYNTLVRDFRGYQFLTPPGSLEPRLNGLEELNESYTYNISKEKLEHYFYCELDSLLPLTGDYVTGIANVYEFPHLIAVGNGERYQGVRVITNEFRYIQDIQYYEEGHSRNLFGKLPLYEAIACKNLYASVGITGSNSLWDRILMVAANFLYLTLIVFLFTRISKIIILRWGEKNAAVKWAAQILLWVILLPVLYIYMLAILDFYHGMWILVFLYLFSLLIGFYQISSENSAKSIYMCPECKKCGVYHPKKVVIKRKIIGKVPYSWPARPLWIEGVEIPDKTYYRETTYMLKGACTSCGYEDLTHYTENDQYPSRTDCPLCGSKMHFSEEDGIYREWCPSCRHFLKIDRNKEGQPIGPSNKTFRSHHALQKRPNNNNDARENHSSDITKDNKREYWKRKEQEALDEVKYYQDQIKTEESNIRTDKSEIQYYMNQISLFGDSDGIYQREISHHQDSINLSETNIHKYKAEKTYYENLVSQYRSNANEHSIS